MTTIEKVINNNKMYFDYQIARQEISIEEIRKASIGKLEEFKGVECFIRIQLTYGIAPSGAITRHNASYEYYGLKDGNIYETPRFAPDYRYFEKTGIEKVGVIELKDNGSLEVSENKISKSQKASTQSFRSAYPLDAKKHDNKWGSENWWATGNRKNGYELFFNN